jgi:hypothetical protein
MNHLSLYLIVMIYMEILSLSILLENNEGDPLSPPKGEAAQGERLLTPARYFPRSNRESLVNLQRAIAFFIDVSAGRS